MFVDFFSRKACTTSSLARLVMASGAPVVPGFIVRQGTSTHHQIVVLPEVEIVRDGDRNAAIVENTPRFTQIFEAMVRRYSGSLELDSSALENPPPR